MRATKCLVQAHRWARCDIIWVTHVLPAQTASSVDGMIKSIVKDGRPGKVGFVKGYYDKSLVPGLAKQRNMSKRTLPSEISFVVL